MVYVVLIFLVVVSRCGQLAMGVLELTFWPVFPNTVFCRGNRSKLDIESRSLERIFWRKL